ncbi:DUF4082 domain-containing protein [Pontibacter ummariensis]|nr:DUF4082 domain-containing protein [Pontibacter ummariensis]
MLTWLDGRNGSSFSGMSWSGSTLSFTVSVASGARNLEGMLPITEKTGLLVNLTINGAPVAFRTETIKGVEYAFFRCATGNYVATYDINALPNKTPTVSLTSPANNATFTAPATINIAANASDTDGTVSRVEFFQGTTKLGEDLTSPYEYSWASVPAGSYQLTARATDNAGGAATSSVVNVTVNEGPVTCPCTVFKPTDTPSGSVSNDGSALQLGMKFRSSVSGYVTGVRFYKQSGNTGTHTGQLYSSTGVLLASVAFSGETASGWQQASFATPVAVSANTTYVISYHSSAGYYSVNDGGFGQAVTNGPLTGLANGTDGGNGVYRYTSSPAFPSSSFQSSNYWVDVVFATEAGSGNVAPAVSLTSPANNATFTAPATINIAANASDTDGTVSRVEFFQGTTKLGEDLTSPYEYSWASVPAGSYQLTARATDNAGGAATSSVVNVTVNEGPVTCPCTVFKPTDTPSGSVSNDGSALQLGMKFRSSVSGYVTGVRFYKQSGNTGTHTGQLYSSTGVLLASVAFSGETASGWQQASFATPVAVSANTTYVISYHSSAGYYSVNDGGFGQAVTNGPLTGLANGTDGGNGVYRYTSSPAFPSSSFQSSNYWVDVVFTTEAAVASTSVASLLGLQEQEHREGEVLSVYPNPFSGEATVSFVLEQEGEFEVGLYDARGALVGLLKQGRAQAGERRSVAVDGSGLSKGLYLVRLQTKAGVKTAKLVLER